MTFQRKLLFGFSLMALPALLIGAAAIRTNVLERNALERLGENMARNRTYAELDGAMAGESDIIWRYLSGMDPTAREEFRLNLQVINYWQERWRASLRPDEMGLATGVVTIQAQIETVAARVFALNDAGQRTAAFQLAEAELRDRLTPAQAELNRDIFRRARESSVRGAYSTLTTLVAGEQRAVLAILVLALATALLASWLISRDLERAQARLVQAERLASIGEMAAAVAHGIRNPLASLRAAAQVALRRVDAPEPREHLTTIIDEVDRLDRRVSHLLNFSRPAPSHPMQEDVGQLVTDLLPPFVELFRERGIELIVDLAPALPDIRIDPMQLEQAVVEIVSNALDAMPTGGRLRVATRTVATSGAPSGIVIEIADTGVGIPADILPTICQPFVTTRHEGTGLGLAIAKRFIEQNRGRLEIESRVGEGTSMRIYIPL